MYFKGWEDKQREGDAIIYSYIALQYEFPLDSFSCVFSLLSNSNGSSNQQPILPPNKATIRLFH